MCDGVAEEDDPPLSGKLQRKLGDPQFGYCALNATDSELLHDPKFGVQPVVDPK
jgi:hypothetical protein